MQIPVWLLLLVGVATVSDESARRRALTASKWSRLWTMRSTENSRSKFSSFNWCNDDKSEATRIISYLLMHNKIIKISLNFWLQLFINFQLTVKMTCLLHKKLAPLLPLSFKQLIQRLRLVFISSIVWACISGSWWWSWWFLK